MVLSDYWMSERIQQQKKLSMQPATSLEPELETNKEIFATELLVSGESKSTQHHQELHVPHQQGTSSTIGCAQEALSLISREVR